MGCCQSTSASDESPSPASRSPRQAQNATNLPHDSSRAAINQPNRSVSNVNSPRTSSVSHPPPSAKPVRSARPNAPIRAPSPLPASPGHIVHRPPPWTREQLVKEREAFFETRVAGREEVWSALKLVCEMLRQNPPDVAEAQGILDAVNVTCPNGRVASGRGRDRVKGGVFDERGELYDLPPWVVTDPEDIVDEDEEEEGEKSGESLAKGGDGAGEEQNLEDKDIASRRSEKGKGRAADIGEMLRLRARLSDRGTDVVVEVGTKEKVGVIVRRIQEQVGPKRIRLAYLGHVLQEGKTLEEGGFRVGNVVNALVFEGDEKALKK